MHYAFPPRKNSNPPAFRPRSSRLPTLRRSRLQTIAFGGLAVLFLLWIFSGSRGSAGIAPGMMTSTGSSRKGEKEHEKAASGKSGAATKSTPRVITGKPPVVIVTVLDEKSVGQGYAEKIRENRRVYAERHGYATHIPAPQTYDVEGSPSSWSKVLALRHALTLYPQARYLWYLDQDALIMAPDVSLETAVMAPRRLEQHMIKDLPVVPPDSIIKTFSGMRGEEVDFVVSQDQEGLAAGSLVVRNGEWAEFFLDTWFNPLYRSYNFQKAETHALEHMVQWHPTILSKLAVVPQRLINAYSRDKHGEVYQKGDLIVRFFGCEGRQGEKSCDRELERYLGFQQQELLQQQQQQES